MLAVGKAKIRPQRVEIVIGAEKLRTKLLFALHATVYSTLQLSRRSQERKWENLLRPMMGSHGDPKNNSKISPEYQ
jgi:hypothetical protein